MRAPQFSIKERESIDQLRDELKGDLALVPQFDNDFNLLRWLQGHDFVLKEVVPKLRSHLELRRLWEVDTFTKRAHEIKHPIVDDYWPYGLLGPAIDPDEPDCNDMVIFLEKSAYIDGFGVLKSCPMTNFLKLVQLQYQCCLEYISALNKNFYFMTRIHDTEVIIEKIRHYERLTGRQWGVLFIFDCEGMVFDKETVDVVTGPFKNFADFMTRQYVEIFKKFLIINTPPVISHAWTLIKPILPKKTTTKVEVLGANWRTEIRKYVHAKNFPEGWGGELRDESGDPMCSQWVKIPISKRVPESMYWINSVGSFNVPLTTVWIPPGKEHSVEVLISEPKSVLHYRYFAHFEYSFNLRRKALPGQNNSEIEAIMPYVKLMDKTYTPEDVQLTATKPGVYVLTVGNDHAWLRSLKFEYHIEVLPAKSLGGD